ncbi:MAG TPA: hypothetical protein PL096_06400 [Micropepsaceae bacterium]|nr:hypothetical protein [Micropepsaceae bacterium]
MAVGFLNWLLRLVILTGVLAAIAWGAWGLALDARFRPNPPSAQLPPPQDLAQSQAQDIHVLRLFLSYDESYSAETRARAEALLDVLKDRAGRMSRAEFELGVAEFVALSGNSQTRADINVRAQRFNRLPVRLALFADGVFVVQAQAGREDLLGRRLLRINDRPVADVLNQLMRYVSGSGIAARADAVRMLESPDLLAAAQLSGSSDGLSLTLSDAGAGEVTRWVDAVAPHADDGNVSGLSLLAGPPLSGWTLNPVLPQGVLWAHEPQLPVFSAPLVTGVYLRLTPQDTTTFVMALNALGEKLAKQKPPFIIVDLRFATGITEPARVFLARLPTLIAPGAPIISLQSGALRGDAMIGLAHLKQAAGSTYIAIGEPPSEGLIFYGEGNTMCLPNSRICVRYAVARHDLTRVCTNPLDCYWPDIFAPVAVDDLEPDIAASMGFADYLTGRDPLLERALDYLKAQGLLAP